MPVNLENLQMGTGVGKSAFITISEKDNAKIVQTKVKLHSFHMMAR